MRARMRINLYSVCMTSSEQQGKLVICPTPLGNLGDMPPRAQEALQHAHTVYAEDTRVTGRLLEALGIHCRIERLDENAMEQKCGAVIARVAEGQTIAYCSDAGMPGVSDPGQRLVDAAHTAGIPVEVLPGPTAVATAYVASGFTCPQFLFGGFFPRKEGDRAALLQSHAALDAVSVYYESPRRIASALASVASVLPLRRVAVCRELTKMHEEVYVAFAPEAAEEFAAREAAGTIKGEIVLVIDAPPQVEVQQHVENRLERARACARRLADAETWSKRDTAEFLQDTFGIARNDAYEMVHDR